MKKILVLVGVLALVAAMVVPMAALANPTVSVTGNVLAATVSLDYPGTPTIPLGMFVVGRNPAGTAWADTGATFGTVTVVNNSDPNPTWTLTATSINDGVKDFSNGKMYCDGLGRYLDDALYVSLDGGTTAAQLPSGVSATGHATYSFRLSAAQIVSQNDVNYGTGNYYMIVQLNASIAP
jgi:type 1 fimbria pilin